MTARYLELGFCGALLAMAALFAWDLGGVHSADALLPWAVLLGLVGLLVLHSISLVRRPVVASGAAAATAEPSAPQPESGRRLLAAFVWLILILPVTVALAGHLVGTCLFLLCYQHLHADVKLWKAIAFSVLTGLMLYLFFYVLLGTPLDEGILFQLVR